jgi:diguanylate cyclase (GGDEF)-like protein
LLLVIGGLATGTIPLLGKPDSPLFLGVVGDTQLVYAALGLAFATRAAFSGRLPAQTRRAWRLMLPAYVLWLVTLVLYATTPGGYFPSAPDICRMLTAPATLIGIWAFVRLPDRPAERAKLRADAALVAVGAAMLLWYVVVSPAFHRPSVTWHEIVPSLLNPLFAAALLFGVSVVLLRGPREGSTRLPLLTLVASILLMGTGDTIRAYTINHGGALWPSPMQVTLWDLALFALILAPYLQLWYARRTTRSGPGAFSSALSRPPRWPYLTVIPGYALLLVTVREPFPAGGLVIGALLASTVIFYRQMIGAEESRRLGITDALTGLANRAHLYDVLPRALARSARNGTRVGVLVIDMNGFKQVNDGLGHAAGDRLLAGFAGLLNRSVLGSDLVARLGGDEFAVVLPELKDTTQLDAVVNRIRAATAEPLDVGPSMVQPSASIGAVLSDPGELSADAVLARADAAMYAAKQNRAAASGRHPGPDDDRSRVRH